MHHDEITDREIIGYFVELAVEQIPDVKAAVWRRRFRDADLLAAHALECVETDERIVSSVEFDGDWLKHTIETGLA